MAGNYINSYDVKTLAQVTYKDLDFNTDGDFEAWLDNELIPQIEAAIDTYCGVPSGFFKAGGTTFTDERYDYDRSGIQLKNYPVISVTKVYYNKAGYGQSEDWEEIDSTDYILYPEEGIIILTEDVPAVKERSIKITYEAGYSAVPDAVKHVCAQLCANYLHLILQRKVSPVVRVDDWAVRMVLPEIFTSELKMVLSPYVRRKVSAA